MNSMLAAVDGGLVGGARWIVGLRGWRLHASAFGAGVAGALSMAPVYALPMLVVAYSILVLLIDNAVARDKPLRGAFVSGWFFGFGYFLVGLYWMAFSFFVQADQFAWMAPFAIMILPAGLALFPALACLVCARFWGRGWARIFVFAAVFTLFEFLRGHILTGLPWNLAGQALAGTAITAQTAAWWGAYGLSLIAILLAAAPVARLTSAKHAIQRGSGFLVLIAGAFLLTGTGMVRLIDQAESEPVDAWVRIVQPNIAQRDKIDPSKWGDNFYSQLELSSVAHNESEPLLIIWPENGAPLLNEAKTALDILARDLPANARLIAGAVRRTRDPEGEDDYFNSIGFFEGSETGFEATAFYDKHHLVPFGEYLPFYGFLSAVGLAQLTPYGDAGFAAGTGPRTILVGGLPVAPLICYEAIFAGRVYPDTDRPRWIVTVTNDAWFGDTSGPRQHLDQARLRSVETGLPMARSANTGISALIDAKGRIVERVGLYERGAINAPLPPALPPTLYARAGDLLYFLMTALLLAAAFWQGRRPRA